MKQAISFMLDLYWFKQESDPTAPPLLRHLGVMASASFETTECSICHDELQDNEEISWLPCRHGFHTECLDAYSSVKGKEWLDMPCPMCKVVPRITEIAGLAQAEADTDTELRAACFWAWNWAETAENTAGSRAAITWLVSSVFWAAETELELELELTEEKAESDWTEEDWARARATC